MNKNESLLLYRFGPRHIRAESSMLRPFNGWTRAAPYESLRVADIGDINVNLFDLKDTCKRIREGYRKIVATGCIPLTLGERTVSICRNTQISVESTLNMYVTSPFQLVLDSQEVITQLHTRFFRQLLRGWCTLSRPPSEFTLLTCI